MRLGLPLGRGLSRGWKRLQLLVEVFALVTLVVIKSSAIRLSDLFRKHGGRRLVEILYAGVVNLVHELCLPEMKLVF